MVFNTGLDQPACNRLKSTMQMATEKYDHKVLRRVRLKSGCNPSPKGQQGRKKIPPLPPQTPSMLETPREYLAKEREKENDRQLLNRKVSFGSINKKLPTSSPLPEGDITLPTHRPVKDWLDESIKVAEQAIENTTYTHDLRKKSHDLKREADKIAKKSRTDTNNELRSKVRDVQNVKKRVELALNDIQQEYHTLGQVRQFIIEMKSMTESGALTGCEMRQNLRMSRPESERTKDITDQLITTETKHHKKATDDIDLMIVESEQHMRGMENVVSLLFSDLEDKVEGLRINEQCLVLDGSSSKNNHMGGTASQQPPLDIILDSRAKEIIQGLYETTPPIDASRPTTAEVITKSADLVLHALSLRKKYKRQLINLDIEGRKLNKKVQDALMFKVKQQQKLLSTLENRVVCIIEERERLEAQMESVRIGLDAKNKEKDIVCKRLRLRKQIPTRETFDKVHDALETEYDVLTKAVQGYTTKLSHIILEISRMHDTYKNLEDTCTMKRTAIAIDKQALDLPFIHDMTWPQHLYNGICSGVSYVYGVA